MNRSVRVIGIGEPQAGDDGVGLAVLEAVRARAIRGVECIAIADTADLVDLLRTDRPVVVLDAVLGSPRGVVVELDAAALEAGRAPVSTHRLSVAQAISLARVLGGQFTPSLQVVAVTIDAVPRLHVGLSPEVSAAIQAAADKVVRGVRLVRLV